MSERAISDENVLRRDYERLRIGHEQLELGFVPAGWGIAVRRIMEQLANMLPWVGLLGIPLLFAPVREALWRAPGEAAS